MECAGGRNTCGLCAYNANARKLNELLQTDVSKLILTNKKRTKTRPVREQGCEESGIVREREERKKLVVL